MTAVVAWLLRCVRCGAEYRCIDGKPQHVRSTQSDAEASHA